MLRSVADGNIGSIMGIGAPAHTGGFIQYVNTYGFQAFIDRCEQLTSLMVIVFSARISSDNTLRVASKWCEPIGKLNSP